MPITVNEGGTLIELTEVWTNEGGTLVQLDTVHSNEGGTLYEIHSSYRTPQWQTYGDEYATISSTSTSGSATTCSGEVKYVGSNDVPCLKCTMSLKAGQKINIAAVDVETYTPGGSGGFCRVDVQIRDRNGRYLMSSGGGLVDHSYTAQENLVGCYVEYLMCKSDRTQAIFTAKIEIV